MNKRSGLFFTVVVLVALSSDVTWAYPSVDVIRFPLDSYVVGSNRLGSYNLVGNQKWHLGDDTSAVVGTRVYTIGNGIVRHAANHAATYDQNGNIATRNYGGMYIVEHNVGGEKVCALYVHMNFSTFTKNVGDEVSEGTYLGEVGDSAHNGGWSVHFHFGIRKGEYPSDPNAYIYGDWIFSGYTSNESVLNNWHNPSDFIAAHQAIQVFPGQLADGAIHQAILDCYNQFSSLVGQPVSNNGGGKYVHVWYSQDGSVFVEIQDFYNQSTGQYYAIIVNPRLGEAFLLKGGFRWYYMSEVDGPAYFGPPTTNESLMQYYPAVNNQFDYNTTPNVSYIAQEFENHKMLLWRIGDVIRCVDLNGSGGGSIVDEVENPFVSISLLPGNGTTLNVSAYALSSTQVYITGSAITNASNYAVYEDNILVGSLNPTNLELTLDNRSPNSTHQYQVVAYDAAGVELLEFDSHFLRC